MKNQFITSNDFKEVELVCNRALIASCYLQGEGIEIGALHKPLKVVAHKCTVKYIDYKTREENKARYPELADEEIVFTDIVDDGFILGSVINKSIDFIIAKHALEHSPDPLGTLSKWLQKLRSNGILYVTIPIAEKCYDKGRPLTTIEHMIKDHQLFSAVDKNNVIAVIKGHLQEFLAINDKNIRLVNSMEEASEESKQELCNDLIRELESAISEANSSEALVWIHVNNMNRIYDIHYHTFSPSSYEILLQHFCMETDSILENVVKNGSGECIGIVRKK